MKTFKIFTFSSVFLFICLFSNKATAQIDVTINPIGALFGNFGVGADFAITPNISAEGVIGFGSRKIDGTKYFALPITAFGKYYFSPKNDNDRFYASVFLRFVNRNFKDDDANDNISYNEYTQTRLGAGFGVGYKIVSKGGFVFDIGLGAGRAFVNKNKFDDGNSGLVVDTIDLMFAGKLGIGYRFGGK